LFMGSIVAVAIFARRQFDDAALGVGRHQRRRRAGANGRLARVREWALDEGLARRDQRRLRRQLQQRLLAPFVNFLFERHCSSSWPWRNEAACLAAPRIWRRVRPAIIAGSSKWLFGNPERRRGVEEPAVRSALREAAMR